MSVGGPRDAGDERRARAPHTEGTDRIEAFTDGVIAIVVTLLVLELHVPEGEDLEAGLLAMMPKFASLMVSFVTVAIYWVNHHHFFDRLRFTDWRLLWANNHFLFWLSLIPFTTALVGDHTFDPLAVTVYAGDLMLTGAAFVVMGQYALFHSDLADESIPMSVRRHERRRGWTGVSAYLMAGVLAWVWLPGALLLFAAIPVTYFVPSLLNPPDSEG
ncbi:MAG: TMEM175 family protein [Dehalococcoidia bacterium]